VKIQRARPVAYVCLLRCRDWTGLEWTGRDSRLASAGEVRTASVDVKQ
jgi:hypothetical protein